MACLAGGFLHALAGLGEDRREVHASGFLEGALLYLQLAVAQASLPLTLLLGVLVALSALGMDMFLPAVPVIARAIAQETGPGAAQVSVTTYLVGLALGQLAWGPGSDRFGRKPILLAGLALALCTALWGAQASTIGELAWVRMAQG